MYLKKSTGEGGLQKINFEWQDHHWCLTRPGELRVEINKTFGKYNHKTIKVKGRQVRVGKEEI